MRTKRMEWVDLLGQWDAVRDLGEWSVDVAVSGGVDQSTEPGGRDPPATAEPSQSHGRPDTLERPCVSSHRGGYKGARRKRMSPPGRAGWPCPCAC